MKPTAVAQGTEAFKTYFAPAERFGLVGTLGEQMYIILKQLPLTVLRSKSKQNLTSLTRSYATSCGQNDKSVI